MIIYLTNTVIIFANHYFVVLMSVAEIKLYHKGLQTFGCLLKVAESHRFHAHITHLKTRVIYNEP